jgi:hypothetical protein
VILEEEDDHLNTNNRFEHVVNLAEKYYDRFELTSFLEYLPRKMPLYLLGKYFKIVYEYQSSRQRNLQVRS